MRVAQVPAGTIIPIVNDARDVKELAFLAVSGGVSVPPFVIEQTADIVTRFVAQNFIAKERFQALGFSL
jgi:hypothetical protein